MAVLRLHRRSLGYVTNAPYSWPRKKYVRHDTKLVPELPRNPILRTPGNRALDLASPTFYPQRDLGHTEHGRDASALQLDLKDAESSLY